jgi:hypothetical protein
VRTPDTPRIESADPIARQEQQLLALLLERVPQLAKFLLMHSGS